MNSNLKGFQDQLKDLIADGNRLYYSLAVQFEKVSDSMLKKLEKLDLPDFYSNYEPWYTAAHAVIKQIIPERLDDFVKLYKNEKRKEIDFLTYTISDCILGLKTSYLGEVKVDGTAAIPKLKQQVSILESVEKRFESKLFDIIHIVQADLFDSELDSARELLKKGFIRASGAVSGVVFEKHLSGVCSNHKITTRKKYPTIADFNELLKKNEVIDLPVWRQIQRLTDIRNYCDHKKDREPTKDEVSELIEGVDKIIKSIF